MSTSPDGAHRGPTDTTGSSTRDTAGDTTPQQTAPLQARTTAQPPVQQPPPVQHPVQRRAQEPVVARTGDMDRGEVLDRQRERFGGIKWGSALFGWLTATGTAVVLTAMIAAAGAAFGLADNSGAAGQTAAQAAQAAQNPAAAQTTGIVSAIIALLVLLVAYYCGGYVAGRMARFNGVKQGIAVWVWAIVIVIVVAIIAVIAGSRFDISAIAAGLPRLPIDGAALSTGAIIAAVAAVVVALVGAISGGLAGMRYHRRIDRVGLDAER